MFQTITGKPFCPIAAIAAPENFSAGSSRCGNSIFACQLAAFDHNGAYSGVLAERLGGPHQLIVPQRDVWHIRLHTTEHPFPLLGQTPLDAWRLISRSTVQ